jgi:hypothetical protein
LFLVGRAAYGLYQRLLRVEASTLMRSPVVLASHLDRLDRSLGELEALQLRARRALYSLDRSLGIFVRTGRTIGKTVTATRGLFGSVSSLRKMLGS